MSYVIKSKLFRNDKLNKAANDHAHHVKRENRGVHVGLLQQLLVTGGAYIMLLAKYGGVETIGPELASEWSNNYYGVVTEEMVYCYKDLRQILNTNQQIDGIVGVLTMRAMDSHQQQLEVNPLPIEERMQAAAFAPHRLKPLIAAGPHAQ